jgi:hypothetical protein
LTVSLFVEWINKIKARADENWLTDAQQAVYESLTERWLSAPFVCLYGQSGTGKSFIARLLSQRDGYEYTQDLSTVSAGQSHVVLDNAEYTRLMRTTATMLGIKRVILVARRPPKDPMPHAELVLTSRDVSQFQRTLSQNEVLTSFLIRAEGTDLGEILRNEAVARGNTHAATRP